ncbi:EAL domain-containing protein [Duganella sp. BJB475]|nr:EAL domain-containing protein [Duganella sp. BJB475]RFP36714.1 EAL domain-containing protein [Duganella sp. BJB476]
MVLTFDGILDSIDVSLQASADEIGRQLSSGASSGRDITGLLVRQQQRLPVVPYLRATNERGDIVYGAGLQPPYISVVGREYFALLQSDPTQRMYISKPLFGRISKKWIWLFARRISRDDGSFGGVVYAVLNIDQIEAILGQMQLDAGGSIALRHAGFESIAGRLGSGQPFPVPIGDASLSPRSRAALRNNPLRGTFVSAFANAGEQARTFSYETSQRYGYHVIASETAAVGMAEWRGQAWIIGGLGAAFLLLALTLLVLIGRAWWRQQRDVAAVLDSQQSMREAQQIAEIGTLCYDSALGSWRSSDIFDRIAGIGPGYPRDLAHLLALVEPATHAGILEYLRVDCPQGHPFDREHVILGAADGRRRWVHAKGRVRHDAASGHWSLICTMQDISQRKQNEREIRKLAYYDMLTGLPNRRLLYDRLQQAMAGHARSGRQGALLLIDLDHFKTLNDTKGHGVGDLLLSAVAERLTRCVGAGDTVARLGGDEFIVLLPELAAGAAALAGAAGERIHDALSEPYDLCGHQHHSSPSIGIALFDGREQELGELMKRADTAMYQAKAAGRNAVRFFDPAMQAQVAAHAAVAADLRQAVAQAQLSLHYQPQIDAAGRVCGAEALLRWRHPRRGAVSPAEFIPVAEDTGLILPIGAWVLETACAQLAAWAATPRTAQLELAVNVSPRQFNQPDFEAQVLAALSASGARPELLKLELTEGLLLDNVDAVIRKMAALKARGIGLSLDDFGTGYSSLSYLKRLPLDQLKIDQSFVRDLISNGPDAAIAGTIIALGRSLGMTVIAEGVETAPQRDWLAAAGCQVYQGYYFSRPLALEQFEAFLMQ